MHGVNRAVLNFSLDSKADDEKNCRSITLIEIQMPVQDTMRSNKNAQYWLICQTLTMHWMSRGVSFLNNAIKTVV